MEIGCVEEDDILYAMHNVKNKLPWYVNQGSLFLRVFLTECLHDVSNINISKLSFDKGLLSELW